MRRAQPGPVLKFCNFNTDTFNTLWKQLFLPSNFQKKSPPSNKRWIFGVKKI